MVSRFDVDSHACDESLRFARDVIEEAPVRQRFDHLLSSELLDVPAAPHVAFLAPPGGAGAEESLAKPAELTWWDWTVFLLHSAAEIEHSLMVQYLFAGYSLAEPPFEGPAVPGDADALVKQWRRAILGIAREEMAHLLTIQNLLHFVGGPLNFEREDFPYRSSLYPFPFRLEPLGKGSLAKYLVAEMGYQPPERQNLR